jgi:biotin carboxyl carrier protein
MSQSRRAAVRVVLPDLPLEVQLSPEQLDAVAPAQHDERVTELSTDGQDGVRRFSVTTAGWTFEVHLEPVRRAELRERAARAAAEHQPHTRLTLRAQIPGRVVRVWAAVGEQVEQGQRLLAIEAMKMENELRSPRAGVIEQIHVGLGDRVERDGELLTLG